MLREMLYDQFTILKKKLKPTYLHEQSRILKYCGKFKSLIYKFLLIKTKTIKGINYYTILIKNTFSGWSSKITMKLNQLDDPH